MQKNKIFFIRSFLLLIILCGGIFLPFVASAYVMPTGQPITIQQTGTMAANGMITNHICPNTGSNNLDDGLIVRIVPCIRDTVIYTTNKLLDTLVNNVGDILKVIFALAIMAFGISMVTGGMPSVSQGGIILALKIGAIIMFAVKFNNMYPPILNALEALLDIMAKPAIQAFAEGGAWNHVPGASSAILTCKFSTFQTSETNIMDIWNLLDCYVNLLVGGIFSDTTLNMGILGFIIGALFSTSIGFFVGFVGLYMLVNALWLIFRTVYIFLTSYVAFSFMVLISIIFIPTILFQSTKQYFDSWLRITISFILQPVFVFGYLIMFLVAINSAIFSGKHSLYYAIAGEDSLSRTNGDPGVENGNFYIGRWLNDIGALKNGLIFNDKVRVDPTETKNPVAETANGQPIMVNPEVTSKLLSRSETAEPIQTTMGNLLNSNPVNFFDIGIPVDTVDWEWLSQRRNPDRWDEIQLMPQGADRDAAIAKFYLDYKIAVLLAFLMAAITIYIFYSLIEYLPFIGTATLGEGGILQLGDGLLAPRGSGIFGARL